MYNQDSRIGIANEVDDNSIDLVITSPPYLNSRDYTDTYMLELKTLGFTKTSEEIKELREKTLRSHVQIKWNDTSNVNNELLENTLVELEEASKEIEKWNDSIIDMVRLYFVDMQNIFRVLYGKMKIHGRIYFNQTYQKHPFLLFFYLPTSFYKINIFHFYINYLHPIK